MPAPKIEFREAIQFDSTVQSSREKYFASVFPKSVISSRHPASTKEGRIAIVTNVSAGCGGRGSVGRDDIAGQSSL
jgi:hypothetical protein